LTIWSRPGPTVRAARQSVTPAPRDFQDLSDPADPPELSNETPPTEGAAALVVALLSAAAATAVVLRHLGTKPLWRDEAISLSVASRPVARILLVLPRHDANAGLYYLVLHAWLRIGHSPAWARGFSAACLIATAAIAAWAASRWKGWEIGLACGLLVAVNPFLVYYGQEARPYSLAVLLATISTVALFSLGRHPSPRAYRVYLVATVALVYADLFAVLHVAAMAGVVAGLHRLRRQPVPPALKRCWWIITGATAPLAAVMTLFERGQISWLPRPTRQVLVNTITSMSGGWLGFEVMMVLAVAAVAAVALALGRTPPTTHDRPVVISLAAAFVVPPLALWSFAHLIPAYIDRYVISSALALVGLAAAGLAVLRQHGGRLVATAVLAALLLIGGQRTARLEAYPYKVDNAPAMVDFIRSQNHPGDAVAYAGGGLRILVESAVGRHGAFPPDIALAPGGEAFRQHDLYAREVDAAQLRARLESVQRLWMITDPSDQRYPQGGPFATLKPMVMATFAPSDTTSFGATEVTLLVRRP
jgi:mannosyltransferase